MCSMQQEKKKFYQTKWFLWIWLVIFSPVGILLLWICHKEMKKKSKIILTIIFSLLFLVFRISSCTETFNDGIKEGIESATQENANINVTTQTVDDDSSSASSM